MGLWTRLKRWLPLERQRTAEELGLTAEHAHPTCLNCGSPLYGPFCNLCGQRDDDFRRPFLQLGNEFFSDMFQWDSRILRSAIPFLFLPGTMTRAFISGRRGHYVSPLRLYFFVSLFFFLILGFSNVALIKFEVQGMSSYLSKQAAESAAGKRQPEDMISDSPSIRELEELRDRLARGETPDTDDAGEAEPAEADAAAEEAPAPGEDEAPAQDPPVADSPARPEGADRSEAGLTLTDEKGRGVDFRVRMFSVMSKDDAPNDQIPADVISDLVGAGDGDSRKWLGRLVLAANIALKRPQVFNNIINVWLPRVMIVLVPFMALILTILYGRRKRLKQPVFYIDSLVFSLNFHAFIFFLMIVLVLKARFVGDVINGQITAWFFMGAVALYLFAGMRTVYQQGYIKTSIKFVFFALFLFFTYATVLLSITIYGLIDQASNAQAAGMLG